MVFFMAKSRSTVRTDSGLPVTRSRSRSRPSKSSGSRARSCSAASGAAVSSTVPEGSTSTIDSRVRYVLNSVPHAIPEELFATTPPSVHAVSLAGSGPSSRPCGASRALTWRTVTPGCTRTRAPSSRTSTALKWRRTSTSSWSVTACPDRDVPPERRVSPAPVSAAAAKMLPTSVSSRGRSTAWGCIR